MGQHDTHGSSCSINAFASFEQGSTDAKEMATTTTEAFKYQLPEDISQCKKLHVFGQTGSQLL